MLGLYRSYLDGGPYNTEENIKETSIYTIQTVLWLVLIGPTFAVVLIRLRQNIKETSIYTIQTVLCLDLIGPTWMVVLIRLKQIIQETSIYNYSNRHWSC